MELIDSFLPNIVLFPIPLFHIVRKSVSTISFLSDNTDFPSSTFEKGKLLYLYTRDKYDQKAFSGRSDFSLIVDKKDC